MKSIAIVILTLSLGGFVAGAAEGIAKKKSPPIPDWAKPYDKNGDGELDQQERTAATKARKDEIYKKYDKNGDGKLDADELKARNEERRKEKEESNKRKAEQDKKKEEKKEDKK